MRVAILATGTDIGKTHIACSLLAATRMKGLATSAFKPVMSGFSHETLAESDAGRLAIACGLEPTPECVKTICLYAFEDPIAPNVAARREGVSIDFDAIVEQAREMMKGDDGLFLVEGAGGVLSPIDDHHSNADLAAASGIPSLLVTANYLGSISHTLSAIEVLAARGVDVAAITVSQPTPAFGSPAEFAVELAHWIEIPTVSFEYQTNGANLKGANELLCLLRLCGHRSD